MSVLNVELFESLDFLSVTRYCEITQGDHQASFGQGAQNAMKTFNYSKWTWHVEPNLGTFNPLFVDDEELRRIMKILPYESRILSFGSFEEKMNK